MHSRTRLGKVLRLTLSLMWLLSSFAAGQTRTPETAGREGGMLGEESSPLAVEVESPVNAGMPSDGSVPRWIRFSGVVKEREGSHAAQPHSGLTGITFALYKEQEGGAPLWMEVQNVRVNAQGRYTVLLGATDPEGLPMEIFTSGEAQWLGIQAAGEKEQPRVLLVSVPYALKAADAEKLGGKPLSSFVLQEESGAETPSQPDQSKRSGEASVTDPGGTPQVTSGTAGRIAKFTNTTDLGDSVMFESVGKIGIGTTSPASILHLSTAGPELRMTSTSAASISQLSFYDGATLGGFFQFRNSGASSPNLFRLGGNVSGSQFAIVTSGTEKMRVTAAGNVGIGTTTPATLLNLNGVSPELRVTSTSATAIPQLAFYENATIGGFFQYRNSGAADPNMFTLGSKPVGSQFAIFTSNSEKVRVDASGNMGIGTTAPGAKLDVVGSAKVSGNFALPATADASTGVITLGGNPFAHAFGTDNTFFGVNAGNLTMSGQGNTAVGRGAMDNNTSGLGNTALGHGALTNNQTGSHNTAVGTSALLVNTASDNTAVGRSALGGNFSGTSNTAVGRDALLSNSAGSNNTAVGRSALTVNTTSGNTAVGAFAMDANTSGDSNTAVGSDALGANTSGLSNTAVGRNALGANGTTNGNTAVGAEALAANTGTGSTAVGFHALISSTGSNNIAIGANAGLSATTGADNIYIGNSGVAAEASTIRIGSSQTAAFMAGIHSQTSSSGIAVLINSSGKLGTTTSSARFKEDVEEIGERSAKLLRLRPVQFRYRPEHDDGSHLLQYGLIAEEVAEVFPELVVLGSDGQPATVRYHFLVPLLLREFQRQEAQLVEQRAQNDAWRADVASLRAELEKAKQALERVANEVRATRATSHAD